MTPLDVSTICRRSLRVVWVAAVLIGCALPALAAQTITTTYRYNADGALTATTTQVDGQAPTSIYNTYDNFTPDAADPTTGNVSAGNGNVVAIGASPGATDSAAFAYDQRDRLSGCRVAGAPAVTYAYHANSLLASSTLAGGDVLQFYYGASAEVANMRQPSAELTSSFLCDVRYVSDGTEQTLVSPRKDVAGVYDPAAATLTPYGYDPYGAPRTDPSGLGPDDSTWDLVQNPFQYSREYRDAACGAYYLRARWYLPSQQVFLSRDPAQQVERYGYTGGNPITRSDPSGMSYQGFASGVGNFMKRIGFAGNAGLSALPYIGPGMFLLQVAALGEFWHHPNEAASLAYMTVFAAAGLGLELPMIDRVAGVGRAFGVRIGAEGVIGVGQSVQAGVGRHGRFDTAAAFESIGATLGGVLVGRVGAGVGYRYKIPGMSPEDVERMVISHAGEVGAEEPPLLVFKARYPRRGALNWSTPLHNAAMDEAVFAYQPMSSGDRVGGPMMFSQVRSYNLGESYLNVYRTGYAKSLMDERGVMVDPKSTYDYIGLYDAATTQHAFAVNPPLRTEAQQRSYFNRHGQFDMTGQSSSNSADHANNVLRRLREGRPASPPPEQPEGLVEETGG